MLEKTRRTIEEVALAPPTPQPASEEELERSTDDDRSGDLLQEEELVAGWGADVLQLPSSLELDIKVQKGPDTLGVSVDSVDKGVNGMLVVAVVSGGAIAKDGRIVPGDYLLSLNNESLRKVTNSQARAILRRAQLLSTDISVTYIPGEAATAYRKSLLESEPPIVPLTKAIKISPSSPYIQKESEVPEILSGDKLVLRESELDSNLVSETATSSAADTGVTESDSITAVSPLQVPVRTIVEGNEQVLLKLGSEPISEVIVTSEPDSVSWRRDSRDDTVSRKDDQSVTSIPPSRSQGSLSDLSSPTMTVTQPPQGHTPSTPMSSSVLLAKHWGPERMVEILREPNCSLGISIVGGKVDLYNAGPDSGSAISGIFIKNVLPHSPAGRTGELKTGDRILEVDGIDLRQASHERAVEVIRGAGNPVCFLVQSLIQWSVDGDVESQSTEVASTSSAGAAGGSERRRASTSPTPSSELLKVTPQPVPQARTPTPELIQAGMADEMVQEIPKQVSQRKPSIIKPKEPQSKQDKQEDRDIEKKKPIYSSSEESEDEEDVRELEGNMYTKKGHEINRASAGNVKRTKEEIEADPEEEDDFGYTKNKVKKKYGGLGHPVLLVQLERGAQGLGLSLAGHKDRNRMAVFVVGLNPAGAAFKTGAIHEQ
ncbi:Inactivation-no-after-potential D protein [Gryllus bimaculatus]|nr:Inactivation-no-after-potential D protein [Gryllus bimaculatus]